MSYYVINVVEKVSYLRRYTIEAEDADEALNKAATGGTEAEDTIKTIGVEARTELPDTLEELALYGPKFQVRFVPQVWTGRKGDMLMQAEPEGDIEWSVWASEVDPEQVRYDLDILRHTVMAPTWARDWSGPFEIEPVDPDAWGKHFYSQKGPDA